MNLIIFFFKNLDVQQIYSKGDKVKFNIEYEVFKNQLKPCAKFVNKIFTLDFDDYKKHKIYHGIFHHSTNTLKNRKVDSKVQLICQDHAMCVEVMNGAEEMVVLLTQLNQYWGRFGCISMCGCQTCAHALVRVLRLFSVRCPGMSLLALVRVRKIKLGCPGTCLHVPEHNVIKFREDTNLGIGGIWN
ncbi:hypothetical protein BH11BAC6_BH11BAC6_07960 [soil metagenome]